MADLGGGLIFPTSHFSDTISVGKVKHFLFHFSDISFFRHLIFPTVFPNLQELFIYIYLTLNYSKICCMKRTKSRVSLPLLSRSPKGRYMSEAHRAETPTFERPVELIYYRGPKGQAICGGFREIFLNIGFKMELFQSYF